MLNDNQILIFKKNFKNLYKYIEKKIIMRVIWIISKNLISN